jgi:APA family basic amino acid/polyamine antiporter
MSSGIASASTLARAFAGDYLSEFVDLPLVLAALIFILLVAAINSRGIAESVKLNVVLRSNRGDRSRHHRHDRRGRPR